MLLVLEEWQAQFALQGGQLSEVSNPELFEKRGSAAWIALVTTLTLGLEVTLAGS